MSLKRKIREQSAKLAKLKANKRMLVRKEERELNEMNVHLGKIIWEFQLQLWTTDWDNIPKELDADIFNAFNQVWVQFCKQWEREKHLLKPNYDAFKEFAIDNTKTNKNDKPIFITGDKLTHLRWTI